MRTKALYAASPEAWLWPGGVPPCRVERTSGSGNGRTGAIHWRGWPCPVAPQHPATIGRTVALAIW
jgi:hypothetical protein